MKELIMEYGGCAIGVCGVIGFLYIMIDLLLKDIGVLSQLIRLGLFGGI